MFSKALLSTIRVLAWERHISYGQLFWWVLVLEYGVQHLQILIDMGVLLFFDNSPFKSQQWPPQFFFVRPNKGLHLLEDELYNHLNVYLISWSFKWLSTRRAFRRNRQSWVACRWICSWLLRLLLIYRLIASPHLLVVRPIDDSHQHGPM